MRTKKFPRRKVCVCVCVCLCARVCVGVLKCRLGSGAGVNQTVYFSYVCVRVCMTLSV